ncbi:MAG: metallophosphoesterase [Clostridia bacterium]|nr:metallophosphoesterase [Clostridia bacterium]
MKIIHTGDVHLGSTMKNLPPEKAKLRQAELMDTFAQLAVYAKNNGVSAVIIAGDLFDENNLLRRYKQDVFAVIKDAAPVGFFYVSGNHDDEFDYEDELPPNLFLFSKSRGWQSYDFPENITLTGMDSKFMRAETLAALSLDKTRFNIVVLHGDIAGGKTSFETIPLTALQNKYVDYLALGHIHKPMAAAKPLDGRGIYRYCGCLEGRGFDECGQRGFFLLDIENGRLVREQFISIAKRTVVEAHADISDCGSYYDVEKTVAAVLGQIPTGSIVKLVLCGRCVAGLRKELSLLEMRFGQQFFHIRAEDETKTFIDYRAYEHDHTARGEFVREVGRREMSEELRAEILDVGLKALAGEEIDL